MISFMMKLMLTLVALLGIMVSTRWSSSAPYVLLAYVILGFGLGWGVRKVLDRKRG